MANIISTLSKAIQKEEFWILPDGRTVSRETMLKYLTPEYMGKVKSGEAANLSLSEYMDSRADDFFMTADLLAEIQAAINPEPEDPAAIAAEPEPVEPEPEEPGPDDVPAEHLEDI